MNIFNHIKKSISWLSILAMFSMQVAPVNAGMISNDELIKQAQHEISVGQLVTILDREDIQQQLTAMGVDSSMAKLRVSQMSESELAEIQQKIEELPAGSGVLGFLLTIFIVLVITDMLGATDVFPFVKNINK